MHDVSCSPRYGEWGVHPISSGWLSVDLRPLTAKAKSLVEIIQEALFAHDSTLVTHEDSDLQWMLDRFSQSAKLFVSQLALRKLKFCTNLHQAVTTLPEITIAGTQLTNVESLKYLGNIITQDGTLHREVDARVGKASQALERPRNRVLNHHKVRLSTKLKVYNAVVIPFLRNLPAPNPSSSRPDSDGWGMSSACRNIVSLDPCCTLDLSMAKGTRVDLEALQGLHQSQCALVQDQAKETCQRQTTLASHGQAGPCQI